MNLAGTSRLSIFSRLDRRTLHSEKWSISQMEMGRKDCTTLLGLKPTRLSLRTTSITGNEILHPRLVPGDGDCGAGVGVVRMSGSIRL